MNIPENGVQIAVLESGFYVYDEEENFACRLWVHYQIERFSIVILNHQDLENGYTGMDWEERVCDPIVSQDANISAYNQGAGWMQAEGEVDGNGGFHRSIFKAGCPVIVTLIVMYPMDARTVAAPVC